MAAGVHNVVARIIVYSGYKQPTAVMISTPTRLKKILLRLHLIGYLHFTFCLLSLF